MPKTFASQLSPNQQRKYLAGLRGKAREQRAAEILYRRTHRSNKPFATDKGKATKRSEHAIAFEQIYGRPAHDVADVARLTGVPRDILEQVYARGMAAWQTGHRPGASQHAWALARVYSFVTGGPTMQGPDKKLAVEAGLAKPNPYEWSVDDEAMGQVPYHANLDYMGALIWIPPPAVAAAAKKGQQLRAKQPKSNQCCMATGIARAKQLSSRSPVSYKDLVTMRAWFARHAVDARGKGWGKDSKGFQAFLMWGGAPGKKWCEDILRRLGK